MERLYFISDVHLGAHSGEIEKKKISRLTSFLTSIKNRADILYIVGDLFDYWFEYSRTIPKVNLKVLSALNQLVEAGTEVRYFTGNHDLWHETYLQTETGIKIYREPLAVTHNSLRLFIAHGDGITQREWKMRLVKRIMQNRTNVFLYRLLHPDIGLRLMQFWSHKSKKKGDNRYTQAYREFAQKKHAAGFDLFIMGHTHKPTIENQSGKYFINLGDWVKNFTYLQLVDATPKLKTWTNDA